MEDYALLVQGDLVVLGGHWLGDEYDEKDVCVAVVRRYHTEPSLQEGVEVMIAEFKNKKHFAETHIIPEYALTYIGHAVPKE